MAEGLLTAERDELRSVTGARWVIIIYNDDITTRDFVFAVLVNIFGKNNCEANHIIELAESEGSAPVKYYSDPSLAEVAIAMVENMKRREDQLNLKLRLFEIIS